MPIEIGFALLILAVIIALIIVLRSVKQFLINAVVGLVILFLANSIAGLGIGYSWLVIIVCALGGALGAILVIILHLSGTAF